MDEQSDFVGFLGELVAGEQLEGPAAGIATKVVAEGSIRSLTQPQHSALILGVKNWISERFPGYDPGFVPYGQDPKTPPCSLAADEVPWCEVYAAGEIFEGRCSYCEQVRNKKDD